MTTDPPNKFSFEDLIHHLPCMVYVCKNDFDWTMLFVSKGGEALTEYKSEELENNATISYGKLIHPNDRTIVWDSVQKAILQREPYQIIYRIITRLGKEKWVWERGCPIFDENNELIVLEGCIFDITSKITSERELAAQEERWRKAFEVSEIGVWDFDVLKGKVFFNSSWFSMLGYELYEIPDNINLFWNLVHDEDRSCIEEKFTSLVKGYESVFECKFRLKTRSGDWQWVYSHAHVVEKDQHGQPLRIIGVQFDITDEVDKERRRVAAELEIRKKQNFESLGLLAGGVAHNFNNLLMIVRGNIELLQCFLKDSSEALGYVNDILKAINRGTDLCRQILTYTGKTTRKMQRVDPLLLLNQCLKLFYGSMGSKITFVADISPELGIIEADPEEFQLSFLNVLLNAVESIEHANGRISVKADTINSLPPLDNGLDFTEESSRNNDFIRIEITDNGCGISEELLPKIFDPFYTTKFQGRGLGLSVLLGMVRRCKGAILTRSTLHKGTSITVFFPVVS